MSNRSKASQDQFAGSGIFGSSGKYMITDSSHIQYSPVSQDHTPTSSPRPISQSRSCIERFLDSTTVTVFMTIITIYALFGDDVRILSFTIHDDDWFYLASTFCLLCFLLELVLSVYAKQGYWLSFYFWLDLIATVSLIPDIGWIWNPIIGNDEGDSSDAMQVQNAGKASRAGTRTSRVIRIIRLIRLIRIVKLYKNARKALKTDENAVVPEGEVHIPQESRVGKKLSELTTKRVICIVLIMLLCLPLFEVEFWVTPSTSWDFGLTALAEFQNSASLLQARQAYVDYHEDRRRPIIFYSNDAVDWEWEETNPTDLRNTEKHYAEESDLVAIFDLRADTQLGAALNMGKTMFVCLVIALGAIYFTKDANQLVLIPIERMIDRVQKMTKNPLAIKEADPTDILQLERVASIYQPTNWCSRLCARCRRRKTGSPDKDADFETTALEDTIQKIGVLLALGFGEAGAQIIATNMQKGADVDPLVKGHKIIAIFGFCDIRQFTDTTEVLQEGVMLFVNEIAQITHSIVDKYQGTANKNIGDAFLLVWKFDSEDLMHDKDDVLLNTKSYKVRKIADMAFISFLKINVKINRSPTCLKYRQHAKLNQLMPNYSIKMGFGLHVGWAIEGAIGSEYKIDASYLSPNVNMTSRLEAATKQYGVPLLLSGELYQILTVDVQEKCRHIDTVIVKGSSIPMEIYTSDMDLAGLTQSNKLERESKESVTRKRRRFRKMVLDPDFQTGTLFETSRELQFIRYSYDYIFESKFSKAMELYIEGNFTAARNKFEECLSLKPRDGPCITLVEFLVENWNTAPDDWQGYRVLVEK